MILDASVSRIARVTRASEVANDAHCGRMPKIENPALFVWDAASRTRGSTVLVLIYCNIVRIINFKTARNGAHTKNKPTSGCRRRR